MTDERLEQILKQALSPEISDAEIEIREKVRKKSMRKIVKAGVAVVAALAVVVGAGFGESFLRSRVQRDVETAKGDHSFIITAYGAELGAEKGIALGADSRLRWLSCDERDGEIAYAIETMFQCEGEGIDHVTYAINRGVFRIVEGSEDSIIVDAKDYEGEMDFSDVIFTNEENVTEENVTARYVTEYTVAGNAQESDAVYFAICGRENDIDIFEKMFCSYGEKSDEGWNELLDQVEITCTAYFTDGDCASKVITVQKKSMEESGIGTLDQYPETSYRFVFGLK